MDEDKLKIVNGVYIIDIEVNNNEDIEGVIQNYESQYEKFNHWNSQRFYRIKNKNS